MTISPFDHPVLSALLGDDDVSAAFSFEAELGAMVTFEANLAAAQAECGLIPTEAASAIGAALSGFRPDIQRLREGVARDGLVVPALVALLRETVGEPHGQHVHFGSTSQDVIDTALVLRLKPVIGKLETRLNEIIDGIGQLERRFGSLPLMGRTRMQRALPITLGDRLRTWRAPLSRHKERLSEVAPQLLVLQCGGPVGTLDGVQDEGADVAAALARRLQLGVPEMAWHTQRDALCAFAGVLSLITGSLGKIGQDVVLMAQNELDEIRLSGAGGSSAMPHKHNPVAAETLVALARFNAAQLGGMHNTLVHEQERSGAAWTLEWLLLPQMVAATAGALRVAGRLLSSVDRMGQP